MLYWHCPTLSIDFQLNDCFNYLIYEIARNMIYSLITIIYYTIVVYIYHICIVGPLRTTLVL